MPKLDWKKSLQNFVKANPSRRPLKDIEKQTDDLFIEYMEEYAKTYQKMDPTYAKIPKFFNFHSLEKEAPTIHNAVQREARSRFLHNKTSEILDKDDLERLWEEIRTSSSLPEDGTERINYDAFLKIARFLPPKCRHFFSASTFLKFDRDEYGRIDSVSFFHSVVRKVSLYQTRIQISLYDKYGNGYLRESDLETFINELSPTFPNLSGLTEDLRPAYLTVAVKKFFFFLDPHQRKRIFIKDILTSPILAEQFDLRNEKTSDEFLNNWFSIQNVQRLVELFTKLDENKDGLLNASELAKFQWSLTEIFLQRVVETLGEEKSIDFAGFVEFILIIENRKSLRAIPFLFRCIDIFERGFIDSFTINLFFKEVLKKLAKKDPEIEKNFRIEDIRDEIFDMANPKSGNGISLYDLYACGQADIILGFLVDAKTFFDYDQREAGNTLNLEDDSGFEFGPSLNCDKGREVMPSDNGLKNILGELGENKNIQKGFSESDYGSVKKYGKYAEI